MILPEPNRRPVWEPAVIAVFLAVLLIGDGYDMQRAILGRARIYDQARDWLETGVAAMMVWGLARALYKAATWKPGADEDA